MKGKLFQKEKAPSDRTTEDWLRILRYKTTGNFLVGMFMGIALMIGFIALAYVF